MIADHFFNRNSGTRLNEHWRRWQAQPPCLGGYAAETRSHGGFLITLQVDVVDAHFAGLDTIHYLLKVFVFDLQSVTD